MLSNDQLKASLFFRNSAGAVIEDNGEVGLVHLCLASGHEETGPVKISTAACDICAPKSRYQPRQCSHIAALALHILIGNEDKNILRSPLFFFFKNSPWMTIGSILFELFGQGGATDSTLEKRAGRWHLTIGFLPEPMSPQQKKT